MRWASPRCLTAGRVARGAWYVKLDSRWEKRREKGEEKELKYTNLLYFFP